MTTNNSMTTPSNYSQEEIDNYLEHLDIENAKLMVPTFVYIGTLIMTGLFGNILVLVVYGTRFKPSTARIFIISLAMFDLMNNTMAQPGEILDIYFAYRFTNNHLCKLKRFFNYFTTFSSIFSLVVVAVDRHRKICKVMRKQISTRLAKILIGCVAVCSLSISLPSLLLNGVKKIPTGIPGILGTECKYADNFQNAAFPKIFLGFQFLLFLSSLTAMIIMYSLIGKTVFKHSKFNFKSKEKKMAKSNVKATYTSNANNSSSDPSSSGTASTSVPSPEPPRADIQTEVGQSVVQSDSESEQKPYVIPTPRNPSSRQEKITLLDVSKSSPGFDKIVATAQNAEKKVKAKKMKTRTTLMLSIITVVFIISYLPYLSISIIKVFNKNFVKNMSQSAFMAYNVVLRSHYINAAVNPLVYSFCNAKFREEARQVLCFWKKASK
ncbi:hypothetical protein SNE40_021635 [Patella caerulea]|uniref:G-protein coupled receptors family 1 profile domain-containing protein n=1 Tax=Patella caerulea TaxID=87958 RepID=A0AAN8GBH2_PATCE